LNVPEFQVTVAKRRYRNFDIAALYLHGQKSLSAPLHLFALKVLRPDAHLPKRYPFPRTLASHLEVNGIEFLL
jgi:hypothetical protein